MPVEVVFALVVQRVPQLRGSGCAAAISSARPSASRGSTHWVSSPGSAIGGIANTSRRSRSAVMSVVERRVLRRRRTATLQHARMVAGVRGGPLTYRQADAPLVAEVEHIADPLAGT